MTPTEPTKPDIVVLASLRAASDQVRDELKLLGYSRQQYASNLRVIAQQSELASKLAAELLERYEKRS